MTDKLAILSNAYGCIRRGDIAGFFEHFDDDAILFEASCLPYGGEHRGKDAAMLALKTIGRTWTDVHFDILEIMAGERYAIAHAHFAARARITGKPISMPLTEIWGFEGGKVNSLRPMYFDTAALVAALT